MPSSETLSDPHPLSALAGYLDGFNEGSKSRGKGYFKSRRVLTLAVAGPEVRAVVRGSHDYDVVLAYHEHGWTSACTCPLGSDCKHAYATGLAWLRRHDGTGGTKTVLPTVSPVGMAEAAARHIALRAEDRAIVAEFSQATGRAPNVKELSWLRNLQRTYDSLRNAQHGYHWFDLQALQSLAPSQSRPSLYQLGHAPFTDFWKTPPLSPLKLWSFIALLFQDHGVPLPDFTVPFTDVAAAENSRRTARREKLLGAWRQRFSNLEAAAATSDRPVEPPATLRLVLGPKKLSWEISGKGHAGPFKSCSADLLRQALNESGGAPVVFDDDSQTLLTALRKRYRQFGRTNLRLTETEDTALIASWLNHPVARRHVVGPDRQPLQDEPRTVTWRITDHPSDPALAVVALVFSDGTPLPPDTLILSRSPARYLCGQRVATGLAPLGLDAAPVEIPREVLALPEAGRFAARSGLKLPGDIAGRFRSEPLQARFRLTVQHPGGFFADLLHVVLHAVNAEGIARARWDNGAWNTRADDLTPSADAAFLLHDFSALQPGIRFLGQFPELRWMYNLSGHITALNEASAQKIGAWLAAVPPGTLVELAPELAAFAAAPTRGHFALEATESGIDWFDVQVKLRVEDTTLTAQEIALLRRANGRFIRLAGKGWRRLQVDLTDADRARLDKLGLDPTTVAADGAHLPRFHALQLADETLGDALPEKLWHQIRARAAAIRQIPAPALPAGLRAELRPYQLEGYHYLAHLSENRFGGVLADDMGLGKTLQALAWLLWLSARPNDVGRITTKSSSPSSAASSNVGRNTTKTQGTSRRLRALVVCPKSVVFNWEHETARFAPDLTTGRLTPRTAKPLPASAHLVIVNYAQLRLHAEILAAETWDAVILDEGQNIKNPASATAQAARALKTEHRLVLTGTPIENRLLDLWSLFAFAQPGLLGGQTQFKRLYNDKTDPGARQRLAHRVRHFLLRRTKNQVARDLPPRTEEDIVVELDGPQRTLYDAELKRARAMLLKVETNRDFDAARFNILQSLLRLRQICCDPRLLGAELEPGKKSRRTAKPAAADSSTAATPGKTSASAKLEALLDTLEPLVAEGHRVLVFSQFVTMLELIRAELITREIKHLMLTGQTENRQELVQEFQGPDGPPVFLLSLKAAGAGLNLTAASYVVLYDPWWNPAVEAQAIDRTHRIGQTAHVLAYRLLARNTVEEKIRALQKEKSAMAAAVVQEESLSTVLDLDSLRQILS